MFSRDLISIFEFLCPCSSSTFHFPFPKVSFLFPKSPRLTSASPVIIFWEVIAKFTEAGCSAGCFFFLLLNIEHRRTPIKPSLLLNWRLKPSSGFGLGHDVIGELIKDWRIVLQSWQVERYLSLYSNWSKLKRASPEGKIVKKPYPYRIESRSSIMRPPDILIQGSEFHDEWNNIPLYIYPILSKWMRYFILVNPPWLVNTRSYPSFL